MATRISLVEQKKIQWAKEREEMARLSGNWGPFKTTDPVRNTIRTRVSLANVNGKQKEQQVLQPLCAHRHYGSMNSLRSLASNCSGACNIELRSFDSSHNVCLHDKLELSHTTRRRSPSLPPICTKDQQYLTQEPGELGVEGLRYPSETHKRQHRSITRQTNGNDCRQRYRSPREEREGETSGYASDSIDAPPPSPCRDHLPNCNVPTGVAMTDKTWQNPYNTTDAEESSLPPSRRYSCSRSGEFNRPRWGSIWGQDTSKGDPPPPSWLERGLSRLDHTNQALVINHESASSPDGSTGGSVTSDTNRTYLRGQNIPIDAGELQEREARRQKALELQNAIKQQLEEKEMRRKEEKERRMREELKEEERIQRERDKEKERFEEEQRRLREKEEAKEKKAEAMREVLAEAERQAKEEKKQRRRREDDEHSTSLSVHDSSHQEDASKIQCSQSNHVEVCNISEAKQQLNQTDTERPKNENVKHSAKRDNVEETSIRLPVSKDVTIVLTGRLDDPEILSRANLQLVNLVMTTSPREKSENITNNVTAGLNALITGFGTNPILATMSTTRPKIISPRYQVENRLLTPSKYRTSTGRDCGTQTDSDVDLRNLRQRIHALDMKESNSKECKNIVNTGRKEADKSTDTAAAEDSPVKSSLPYGSKIKMRKSIESRPRWNANRPGTRYRTQSEKDPHYQQRLRLRRRRVETSDEGSRSPSPDRRRYSHVNPKLKWRSSTKISAFKMDSYDADLSMESLNYLVPIRTVKDGRVKVDNAKNQHDDVKAVSNQDVWCRDEIIPHFPVLKNGLMKRQKDWEEQICSISPITELH